MVGHEHLDMAPHGVIEGLEAPATIHRGIPNGQTRPLHLGQLDYRNEVVAVRLRASRLAAEYGDSGRTTRTVSSRPHARRRSTPAATNATPMIPTVTATMIPAISTTVVATAVPAAITPSVTPAVPTMATVATIPSVTTISATITITPAPTHTAVVAAIAPVARVTWGRKANSRDQRKRKGHQPGDNRLRYSHETSPFEGPLGPRFPGRR